MLLLGRTKFNELKQEAEFVVVETAEGTEPSPDDKDMQKWSYHCASEKQHVQTVMPEALQVSKHDATDCNLVTEEQTFERNIQCQKTSQRTVIESQFPKIVGTQRRLVHMQDIQEDDQNSRIQVEQAVSQIFQDEQEVYASEADAK